MANSREEDTKLVRRRRPPGTTPEARENQLVALAVDRAEQQLRDGTASAQVITHYLKLGSTRERLEQERLVKENDLLEAKRQAIGSEAEIQQLYKDALNAMRTYSGNEPVQDYD